jgi:NAD(P)-dependent dehydrogenase (short-subunit alcohol dehydrogenase family)
VDVRDKVVVVTGGGGGIGQQLVLELLRRGARVAAADLRRDGLERTAELAGVRARLSTVPVDVTDRAATAALPEQDIAAHGAVDGVINNAGIIQPFERVQDLGFDAIDRVIDVNLNGTINVVKAFLPHLLGRPVAHLANVASMGAFLPVPGQSVYGASKAAVKLLTEGLYAELLPTRVGVTVVMPGAVETGITENSGVAAPGGGADAADAPRMPITAPEDAARAIVDGIEADRLHVYVGVDSRLLNLACRVAPRLATHLVQRQMAGLLAS